MRSYIPLNPAGGPASLPKPGPPLKVSAISRRPGRACPSWTAISGVSLRPELKAPGFVLQTLGARLRLDVMLNSWALKDAFAGTHSTNMLWGTGSMKISRRRKANIPGLRPLDVLGSLFGHPMLIVKPAANGILDYTICRVQGCHTIIALNASKPYPNDLDRSPALAVSTDVQRALQQDAWLTSNHVLAPRRSWTRK